MRVTKITAQQKDTNRVNIFIDDAYAFSLTINQLLDSKIKVGSELQPADIVVLEKVSADGKLRAKALDWVMLRPRSSAELKTYLYKKKADVSLQTAIMSEFAQKKYQDDAYFAKWWVENRVRKNKSNLAIKTELQQKGIAKEVIDAVLEDTVSQKHRLQALVEKKNNQPKYKADPLKFKKYLLSKGFSYSDIDEVLADDTDGEAGNF